MTGWPNLSRKTKFSGVDGDRGKYIFPGQQQQDWRLHPADPHCSIRSIHTYTVYMDSINHTNYFRRLVSCSPQVQHTPYVLRGLVLPDISWPCVMWQDLKYCMTWIYGKTKQTTARAETRPVPPQLSRPPSAGGCLLHSLRTRRREGIRPPCHLNIR